MATRYFKVVDTEIMDAIKSYIERRQLSQKIGNEIGRELGVGKAVFRILGLWGLQLAGFELSRKEHKNLDETAALWTIPKDGFSRPKSIKSSDLHKKFVAACKEVDIQGASLEVILGFNHMDYFPSMPGYTFKPDKGLFVFLMPERCNHVNGCEEITNIEFLSLTKDEDND